MGSEFWGCHFWDKNSQLVRTGVFLEQISTYPWSTYCPPSWCIIRRKSLEWFPKKLKICKISPFLKLLPPMSEEVHRALSELKNKTSGGVNCLLWFQAAPSFPHFLFIKIRCLLITRMFSYYHMIHLYFQCLLLWTTAFELC